MEEQERAAMSAWHQRAWGAFWVLHPRMYRSLDAAMNAAGALPMDWYDTLLMVSRAPQSRLRLSELADCTVLTRSGVSRLVDRLEAAGLLTREECPHDRRGAFAALTQAGREALERSWPIYEAAVWREFGRFLSEDEARTLAELLERASNFVPMSDVRK